MAKFELVKDVELAQENTFVVLLSIMAILQQLGATKDEIHNLVKSYLYDERDE